MSEIKSTVESNPNPDILKTALVAIIGRPSAGKSTFLNTACQEAVSIVSPMPQTTRNAIRGIVNTSYGQLVFVDTPGYHDSEKKLNLKLRGVTKTTLEGSDCVLYVVDSSREPGNEEKITAELIKNYQKRMIVAINKTDLAGANPAKAKAFVKSILTEIPDERILEMSAKKDKGINEVLKALYDISPVAPAMYTEDFYTDQDMKFRISEAIRGEAINRLEQEIPHAVYVNIADLEFRNEGKKLWVRAFLCVERESQKGIVIGKGASKIKEIRAASLKALNMIYPYKVELDLQVKVDKNWRQKDLTISRLIPQ